MPRAKWMILRVYKRPGAANELVKTCDRFEEAAAFCLSTNPLAMGWMDLVAVRTECPQCGQSQRIFERHIGEMSGTGQIGEMCACPQCGERFAVSRTSKETVEVLDVAVGHRPEYTFGYFLAKVAVARATSMRMSLNSPEYEEDLQRPGTRLEFITFHFAALLLKVVDRKLAESVDEAKRFEIMDLLSGTVRDIMVEYAAICGDIPSSERSPQHDRQLEQPFIETYEMHSNSYARLPLMPSSGPSMFGEFVLLVMEALVNRKDLGILMQLESQFTLAVTELLEQVHLLIPGSETTAGATEPALEHADMDELPERQSGCLGMAILIPALIANYLLHSL